MPAALNSKKVEALANKRPAKKVEIADGGQPGLYLIAGPRTMKWMIRYRSVDGENVKYSFARFGSQKPGIGLHEARTRAQALLRVVAEGRDPRSEVSAIDSENMSVGAAFERFVEQYVKTHNKPKTIANVQSYVTREIVPAWRHRRIESIGRRDIINLVDRAAADHLYASIQLRAILSKSFSWFASKAILQENPFRDIARPGRPESRDRVLSAEEIRWLWKASNEIGWPFGQLAQLLLLTGQRRSEIADAEWIEIDLECANPTLTIPATRSKNSQGHAVPLSRQAVEIIGNLPRVLDPSNDYCRFFLTTNGRSSISGFSKAKSALDKGMSQIAEKERGEPVLICPWRFHDIRRTAATGLASIGTLPHIVEAVLNHRTGSIAGVAKIYNRFQYEQEKREALQAWADHVDRIVQADGDTVVKIRS